LPLELEQERKALDDRAGKAPQVWSIAG
jgi:hypothetical protein